MNINGSFWPVAVACERPLLAESGHTEKNMMKKHLSPSRQRGMYHSFLKSDGMCKIAFAAARSVGAASDTNFKI
ncbi:hypothetical protein ACTJK3_24880 [Pseudomonas sp. 22105]|uniref:hypothetical protein n=1 Tax=unclassified Pseudomonas TaxID=196821 RepID=UPI003F8708C9